MPAKSRSYDYSSIKLLDHYVIPKKQAAKRHYGSHQFFTKRAWNVVQAYISNFSKENDVVLDPFGGSGVTAIESLILGRRAINVDISPLSVFLTRAVAISPVDINGLTSAYQVIKSKCESLIHRWFGMTEAELQKQPLRWWYPNNYRLPTNADRGYVHELFTRRQLLSLSYLLSEIAKIKSEPIRELLRYNFAATLYKCNLTFLSARGRKESRGGSSIFSIYRYKVAREPVELDVWDQFELRFRKLLSCKQETNQLIGDMYRKRGYLKSIRGSATRLTTFINPRSVDYIFTDPPYGAHIAYLDLSGLWNAWLGFRVSKRDYQDEVIEGGSLAKTQQDYFDLLDQSFCEMFNVLKYDRWMSVVFAHKDPAYWDAVVKAAVKHGFHYMGTNVQPLDVVWSMHKKKNYLTVVSGELILNFLKARNPVTMAITDVGSDAVDIIRNSAELTIVRRDGATTDEIYHDLIPKLIENGLLGEVKKNISDITPILSQRYDYDDATNQWRIRPNTRLGTAVPLESRIRFYVLDFMKRAERQGRKITFDDIVHDVLPNLVNGDQPTRQTISEELKKIAVPADSKHWKIAPLKELPFDLDLSLPMKDDLPRLSSKEANLSHNDLIVIISRMGRHSGFSPVIGKRERSSAAMGELLSNISGEMDYSGLKDYDQKKAEQIDCIWALYDKPLVAFEVEMSTAITSGIERFASILKGFSGLSGHLILVVPGRRKSKLTDVLLKSTFVGHPMYMENKIKFLYVKDLIAAYDAFARQPSMAPNAGLRLLHRFTKSPQVLNGQAPALVRAE